MTTTEMTEAAAGAWVAAGLPAGWQWQIRESSRATRIRLAVGRDSILTIIVPAGTSPEAVTRVVRIKAQWIAHGMAEAARCKPDHKIAEMVGAESFRWMGRNTRLDFAPVSDTLDGVRKHIGTRMIAGTPSQGEPWFDADGHGWWLRMPEQFGRGREAADAIIRLYATAGAEWARERLCGHDPHDRLARLGLRGDPPSITAGDTGEEWARYDARTSTVIVHWAIFQANLPVIDYVITYGLVWATRPPGARYGPEFRRRLARIHYTLQPHEDQLAEETRHLWMGAIA